MEKTDKCCEVVVHRPRGLLGTAVEALKAVAWPYAAVKIVRILTGRF